MLMLAEFCNEELRTRTELPEHGVAVHQQLTYSLDVYFLQRFMFARFIVTAVRRGTIHLLACLPSPAGPRVAPFPQPLHSLANRSSAPTHCTEELI